MRTHAGRTLLASALAFALVPVIHTPATAQSTDMDDRVIGTWEGNLAAANIGLVYHVTRAEDGSLTGTMDVPAQGATGIQLQNVSFVDGKLSMSFPVPGGGKFEGSLSEDGKSFDGTFTQGASVLPLTLEKSEGAPAPLARPQEPVGPLPYSTQDVTFANAAAGISLAGTLTLPEGAGPFPAVVLVSGSGPQDRDEALLGHKPFLVLADHLSRDGIAVLRFDDRGVGASEGVFSAATTEDFATDAIAAVDWLRTRPEIAADRVGIAGHSEGGLVGPMAANRSGNVAFVVMLAGPGLPGIDILVAQGELINRAAGADERMTSMNARVQKGLAEIVRTEPDPAAAAPKLEAFMRAEIASLPEDIKAAAGSALGDAAIRQSVQQMNSPWFRFFLHHDPRPDLEQLAVPVLAIVGSKDLQVPAEVNAREIEAAFARGRNPDTTVRILPDLNHLFQRAQTGAPSEYAQITETMNPAVLGAVSEWIAARFKR